MANRFSRPFPIATYSLTNLLCPPLCAFEFLYRIPYSDYFFAFMSTNESTNNIIGDQNPGQSAAAAPASTSSAPPPKRRRRLTVDASRGPRVAELKSAATKGLRNYIRALGCVGAEAPSESMMSQGLANLIAFLEDAPESLVKMRPSRQQVSGWPDAGKDESYGQMFLYESKEEKEAAKQAEAEALQQAAVAAAKAAAKSGTVYTFAVAAAGPGEAPCANCRSELRADQEFCEKCGTGRRASISSWTEPGQAATCTTCRTKLRAGQALCGKCGTRSKVPTSLEGPAPGQEAVCTNCRTELRGQNFCGKCGTASPTTALLQGVSPHFTFTNAARPARHVTDTAESIDPAQGLFQAEKVALASAAGEAAREVMRRTAVKARRAVGNGIAVPLKHFRCLTPTEMVQQADGQQDGFLALNPVSGSIKVGAKSARAIEGSRDFMDVVKHWKRYLGTVFPATLLHMHEDLERVERWIRWSGWEAARDWVELERALRGDTVWLRAPKGQALENLQTAERDRRGTGLGAGRG